MICMADAVTLRRIVALLEESPATAREISMMQYVSNNAARRLCKKLQQSGVIEHPKATRTILGVSQQVPLLEWRLTEAYRRGEIQLDAETLTSDSVR
jgi:predicted ArsR family transcriptional regulator